MIWLWLTALFRLLLLDANSDEDDPDDDDTDEDEEDDGNKIDDAGATKDPKARIRSLLNANNRLSKKLKARDKLIAQLQDDRGDGELLRTARLEAAFLRAVMAHEEPITDIETAWELANLKNFLDPVKDDGEGMPEALGRLLERYPYLVDDDGESFPPPAPTKRSGRVVNKPREKVATGINRGELEKRFPALKGRR